MGKSVLAKVWGEGDNKNNMMIILQMMIRCAKVSGSGGVCVIGIGGEEDERDDESDQQ